MTREQVLERFFLIAETHEGFEVQDPQTGAGFFIPRGGCGVLITGKGGKSGSWLMRGEQLGAALGATVQANATIPGDLTIVVKRTPTPVISALRGKRWVWDIVDAYPQPLSYQWTREEAIGWVRGKIASLRPTAIIWPTRRMREDCDTGLPGLVLPHHHRIGIERNPIRAEVRTIGYEGSPGYLGRWERIVRQECEARGWEFVVNPERLADVDVVLALRDSGGYVARHWKSGVKLANAHASGTPFIGQAECGYTENASGAEYWAEDARGLSIAFDWLKDQGGREAISDRFVQRAYSVEQAAADLKEWLHDLG